MQLQETYKLCENVASGYLNEAETEGMLMQTDVEI